MSFNCALSFMSLTKKLVLTFLLMTLIPIGVIIWVSRQTLVEQAQEQIGTRLKDSVVQVGKSMDEFMFNCIHNIQTMAANPDMAAGDLKIANADLTRLTYSFSFFDQVMLVNPQGVIIASSDST
jgi:sensor domain CHASE-containing protein